MIPFLVICGIAWVVGKFLADVRPRQSSAFIFFPIMLILCVCYYMVFYAIVQQSDTPLPISAIPLHFAFTAALVGSVTIWNEVKRYGIKAIDAQELAVKRAEFLRLEEEEARREKGDDPRFDSRPAAAMAIRHRPEVACVWEKVDGLGAAWAIDFLDVLNLDPKVDPTHIADVIGAKMEEIYPYSEPEIAEAYQILRSCGASAQKEFRSAIFVLGSTVNPSNVAKAIEDSLSPPNSTAVEISH